MYFQYKRYGLGRNMKKEEENEEKGDNKGENGEWGGDSKKVKKNPKGEQGCPVSVETYTLLLKYYP